MWIYYSWLLCPPPLPPFRTAQSGMSVMFYVLSWLSWRFIHPNRFPAINVAISIRFRFFNCRKKKTTSSSSFILDDSMNDCDCTGWPSLRSYVLHYFSLDFLLDVSYFDLPWFWKCGGFFFSLKTDIIFWFYNHWYIPYLFICILSNAIVLKHLYLFSCWVYLLMNMFTFFRTFMCLF